MYPYLINVYTNIKIGIDIFILILVCIKDKYYMYTFFCI